MSCRHNARCRYTHGFLCEDCYTFIPKDSPEYRSDELLGSIWMVLHNINAELGQSGHKPIEEVSDLKDRIGIGIKHENYEELIAEAEKLMAKYGKSAESATITLTG